MLNIHRIYKDENENYLTASIMRRFLDDNQIDCAKHAPRAELLSTIIDYGNESDQNEELVLTWLDGILFEGIRDVHMRYFLPDEKTAILLQDLDKAVEYFSKTIHEDIKPHVCSNQYDKDFTLVDVRKVVKGNHKKVIFAYCKELFVRDPKTEINRSIVYPVMAEYYVDEKYLLVMAKPRTNLYEGSKDGTKKPNFEAPVTVVSQINEIFNIVGKMLIKEDINPKISEANLKLRLYSILDKYTRTPAEIENIIVSRTNEIDTITNMVKNICFEQNNSKQPSLDDIKSDIRNIVEKHLSINWSDSRIFIQDREAYPIRLNATDEEKSQVQQTSALREEPLQRKSLFFDNKKMLHKNESCDGVVFSWNRKDKKYFKPSFLVNISIKKGECIFKFTEYTMKEDIENVIFSVIGANEQNDKS